MAKLKAKKKKSALNSILAGVRKNRLNRGMLRHIEWPLIALVLALSLFGVASIFAATGTPVENTEGMSFLELIRTQPITYARLQLIWMVGGFAVMIATVYFDYEWYGTLKDIFYWGNVALLVIVLGMEAGRGNSTMFYEWGEGRTFQPAEVGKIAIIIALAKLFANREKPIMKIRELIQVSLYVGLPLGLIIAQPDVGTALVYIAIFAGMVFASNTNYRLILGIVCIAVLVAVPMWYMMSFSENFRVARIQVWLDPTYDPNGKGLQTTNARIAFGSGGLFGKGLFAEGNFASMSYIPDDHTDFIFAIVGETFGFVGAAMMVLLFLILLGRMLLLSMRAKDPFGSYIIVGVTSMLLFHIFENIAMVVGLMPVTGIPLPFVSYGGSNYLTSMIGIGLVVNVALRSRIGMRHNPRTRAIPMRL